MSRSREGRPRLSVIVPVYNEAGRLEASVRRLGAYLRARLPGSELLVVDDGSTDATPRLLAGLARAVPGLVVHRLPANRGKGAAVRRGLALARGRVVVFTDCDLSTPPAEIPRAVRWIEGGDAVAIGSRALPGSRLPVPQPWARRLAGRVFNLAVRVLLGLPYADTQCGFKAFDRATARALARDGRMDGFAFDVELLLLAKRRGARVREFPVTWRDRAQSKVRLVRHAPAMFRALFELSRRFADVAGDHPARTLPLILASCAMAVTGQILYKQGALALPVKTLGADWLVAMATSPGVLGGVLCFGVSAFTWLMALARVDLSFAFPMLSLNFVFTALWAWAVLGERLSAMRLGGIGLVVAGVLVIAGGHGTPAAARAGGRA